jgi:hypothetical protein
MKRKAELECDAPAAKSVAYETLKKADATVKKLHFAICYANKKKLPSSRGASDEELEEKCRKYYEEFNAFQGDYYEESELLVYKFLVNVFFTMTENNQPVKVTEADIWACLSKEITGQYTFLYRLIMKYVVDGGYSNDMTELFADIRFAIIEHVLAVYTGEEYETFEPKFGLIKTIKQDDGYLLTLNKDFMQVEEYPASPDYEAVNV